MDGTVFRIKCYMLMLSTLLINTDRNINYLYSFKFAILSSIGHFRGYLRLVFKIKAKEDMRDLLACFMYID